jgi:hypothetical protein
MQETREELCSKKKKFSEGVCFSKPDYFSYKIYFHISTKAYDLLTPVIDSMTVGLQRKFSRIIVWVEEGFETSNLLQAWVKMTMA